MTFLFGYILFTILQLSAMNLFLILVVAAIIILICVLIYNLKKKQKLKIKEGKTLTEVKPLFRIEDTLGETGLVQNTIAANKMGSGKVQVTVKGITHELEAKTEEEKKIYAGNSVKVVKIENQILLVERIR